MNTVTVTPTAITVWNTIGLECAGEIDLVQLGLAIQPHCDEATLDQTQGEDGFTVLLHYACSPETETALRDAVRDHLAG